MVGHLRVMQAGQHCILEAARIGLHIHHDMLPTDGLWCWNIPLPVVIICVHSDSIREADDALKFQCTAPLVKVVQPGEDLSYMQRPPFVKITSI